MKNQADQPETGEWVDRGVYWLFLGEIVNRDTVHAFGSESCGALIRTMHTAAKLFGLKAVQIPYLCNIPPRSHKERMVILFEAAYLLLAGPRNHWGRSVGTAEEVELSIRTLADTMRQNQSEESP